MLGQLLSKDVLYEPMKELYDRVRPAGEGGARARTSQLSLVCALTPPLRAWSNQRGGAERQFPTYLEENRASLSVEDTRRYRVQYEVTAQIVQLYSTTDSPDPKRLMELMTSVGTGFPCRWGPLRVRG